MSDHGFFPPDSPFKVARIEREAGRRLSPSGAREQLERLAAERMGRESAVKEARAPIEHWRHDLETILILLEEHHPDVRRSSDLIREIQREMERWVP